MKPLIEGKILDEEIIKEHFKNLEATFKMLEGCIWNCNHANHNNNFTRYYHIQFNKVDFRANFVFHKMKMFTTYKFSFVKIERFQISSSDRNSGNYVEIGLIHSIDDGIKKLLAIVVNE